VNTLPLIPDRKSGWEGRVFDVITAKIIAKCQEYGKDWQVYSHSAANIELSVIASTLGEIYIAVSRDTSTNVPHIFVLRYNDDPSDTESVCFVEGIVLQNGIVDIIKHSSDIACPEEAPVSAGELEKMLYVIDSV
jgi:hypothetical protein